MHKRIIGNDGHSKNFDCYKLPPSPSPSPLATPVKQAKQGEGEDTCNMYYMYQTLTC